MNITVTDEAAHKLRQLLAEEAEGTGLRIYVQGGGCSGFQYGFQFETDIAEDDNVAEVNGVKVIIDSMSYCYLDGITLAFESSAFGSSFNIINPNSKGTCGCGASFNA